ncbi:Retrovirus-related Pol polyprotein from transposon TNT 1-94 [Gossypium australe]|uniref:Retrovirus-related Pol polyprotein from transposon TNT 1-94 n=1 Tax=Gossypium australe TaxID=47621 RepID=A0A5B6VQ74_9ROSI|nr:Retrovirus-related Pol polyprotein from transposon TNT 1-94 [Gossypium australe]
MTIMEMTRCMLHEKSLSEEFWVEAGNTTIFLLNRLPTRVLEKKTFYEALFEIKPTLENLKVFGCLCFYHVPQVKRDKLGKKSKHGIFVGYSLVSKAYRIYQPQTWKMIVSRDVQFLEDEQWDWTSDVEERKQEFSLNPNELVDDTPIRGIRSLSKAYQRCNIAILEPAGYEEAKDDNEWIEAMKEELGMIEKNQKWELVERPANRKVNGVKWVFRTKLNPNGSVNKYKARMDTIRMLLATSAQQCWKMFQLDVKSAFLNGLLEKEIYVEQPEGFITPGQEGKEGFLWAEISSQSMVQQDR